MKTVFFSLVLICSPISVFAESNSLKCNVKINNSKMGVPLSQMVNISRDVDISLDNQVIRDNDGMIFQRGSGSLVDERLPRVHINGDRVIDPKDAGKSYWRYDGVVYLNNGSLSFYTLAYGDNKLSPYHGAINGWQIDVACKKQQIKR